VGQKSDTSRTLHYIVREVSLFWPTLYSRLVVTVAVSPLLFETMITYFSSSMTFWPLLAACDHAVWWFDFQHLVFLLVFYSNRITLIGLRAAFELGTPRGLGYPFPAFFIPCPFTSSYLTLFTFPFFLFLFALPILLSILPFLPE